MDIRVAKRIIGEKVNHGDNTYILTACILRKNTQGQYHYQAELHELKANCVHIVALDNVEEVQGE